jgi:hypothetical protein
MGSAAQRDPAGEVTERLRRLDRAWTSFRRPDILAPLMTYPIIVEAGIRGNDHVR